MNIRHTSIVGRLRAILVVACVGLAAAFGASPAVAADFTINPGEVASFFSGTASNATVDPASAGSVTIVPALAGLPLSARIDFASSINFSGTATITWDSVQLGRSSVTVQVGTDRQDVSATFTPRPAPGPCILIGSGATVSFGDVTIGATQTGGTSTEVRSCASIDQSISASVSAATSGSGQNAITWQPTTSPTVGPNGFSYGLRSSGETTATLLPATGAVAAVGSTLAPASAMYLEHTLAIGAGSTTGIGQPFSATVSLIAAQV